MADNKETPDASLDDETDKEGEQGAEGGEGAGDPLLEEDSGKKKKMLLIGAGVLVLLLAGGAGAYFMGFLDGWLGKGVEAGEHAQGEPQLDEHGNPNASVFLPIPDMIVNLNSTDSTPRYLRLSVQLELKSEADKARVEAVI